MNGELLEIIPVCPSRNLLAVFAAHVAEIVGAGYRSQAIFCNVSVKQSSHFACLFNLSGVRLTTVPELLYIAEIVGTGYRGQMAACNVFVKQSLHFAYLVFSLKALTGYLPDYFT